MGNKKNVYGNEAFQAKGRVQLYDGRKNKKYVNKVPAESEFN